MEPSDRFAEPPSERMFNAPLLPVLVAASMPVLFLLQTQMADGGLSYALVPADLWRGGWPTLFTSMLLHGDWVHALMNAVGALAFGAPVARLLAGPRGVLAFIGLYIVSGMLAALGYGLVHAGSEAPMVGASGAVFGLIGAATRLMGGAGRVLPLTDRRVIMSGIVWMAVNAVTGLVALTPGAEGPRIAWEAHAFGFLIGVLAIGPLARLFGRATSGFDSAGRLRDPAR